MSPGDLSDTIPAMSQDGEVFNIHQVAEFLGVHVQTVRKLARRQAIPAFKVGRDWRFRKAEILRWSDEQTSSDWREDPNPGSVLIIDDEEKVCRVLARMVERCGYTARTTLASRAGLEMVARQAPDLILLDLKMPEMDGPQFLKILRETEPELPVVLITAYPDSELVEQATQHAPLLMLPKPVKFELLERTLRMVLETNLSQQVGG